MRQIEYHDNAALWALGQESKVSIDGVDISAVDYDGSARPSVVRESGRVVRTLAYNNDGTIQSIRDGGNHQTSYSNWKRGLPQLISYPATPDSPSGSSVSIQVGDTGQIDQVVDELGATTIYSYDAAGRLSRIDYPSGDSTSWNATQHLHEQVWADEWGIAPGHWRQVTSTGNGRKITYFDALLRPVLVREFDAGNEIGTQRFVRKSFKWNGSTSFASYPSHGASAAAGVRTTYDSISRPTSITADTEHGPLVSTYEYLPGFKRRSVNARGMVTITDYRAWSEPTYSYPVVENIGYGTLEHIVEETARDSFGRPTSIARRGFGSTHSVRRSFVYDQYQQLCKIVEPETGATVIAYDLSGNVAWHAAGHHELADTGQCNTAEAYSGGRRVERAYDARGREISVRFPDGLGNTDNSFTPTGLLSQTVVDNGGAGVATTVYTRNKRGMVTGEAMGVGEVAWGLGYGFDANGHLASHNHSLTAMRIDYFPNALGQATQASAFAIGAHYHPNGALKQFVYGNGVSHSMTQNTRGLVDRSQDLMGASVVRDDSLDYDANGNVAAISDARAGNRGDRTMQYDALDRLIHTTSPMFGTASYSYDALDNIRSLSVSGGPNARQHVYHYDASNKLSSLSTPGGSSVSSLSYDAQGNLASKDGRSFQFDYGNRLRSVAGADEYRYDGHGRRVQSIRAGKGIYSIYGHDGVLRFQRDEHRGVTSEIIYLSGKQIARVETPIQIDVPQLAAPALSTTGSFAVSWSSVRFASRYELEEWRGEGPWNRISDTASLSIDLTHASGVYGYRVRGCATVCGGWSNEGWVEVAIPPPPAPDLTVPAGSASGSYLVSWSAGASGGTFGLEESFEGGSWADVYTGPAKERAFSGRANGIYRYRVRHCMTTCSVWSTEQQIVVALALPGIPALTIPSSSGLGSFDVSWTSSALAERYELQERLVGADWALIHQGSENSIAVSGRIGGTHSYRVRACSDRGCSDWSAVASLVVTPQSAPQLTASLVAGSPNIVVSWTSAPGASRYLLQERLGQGAWSVAHDAPGLSQMLIRQASGTYDFRVQACNLAGCGNWSSIASVQVSADLPSAPTVTLPNRSINGTYTVSWTESTGASSYQLEELADNSAWRPAYQGAQRQLVVGDRASGKYQYRARACNESACGTWSGIAAITVVQSAAPNLTVPTSRAPGDFIVSWSEISGSATDFNYELMERANNGAWTSAYYGPQTNRAMTMRDLYTSFSYRVRYCNALGCGGWSAIKTIQGMIPPPGGPQPGPGPIRPYSDQDTSSENQG
ncbi:hypothetical protein [Luteimonas sp. TWI1437]|uniref:hypothetical protein n=1 Tax=unclassified Luteimonas TaxID=2629088 RepID=UPI00320B9791